MILVIVVRCEKIVSKGSIMKYRFDVGTTGCGTDHPAAKAIIFKAFKVALVSNTGCFA